MRLRAELETLKRESRTAAEIAREAFSHANVERCTENQDYQDSLTNLQKRIAIMEKEKESVFQLWQMSLKVGRNQVKVIDMIRYEYGSSGHVQ